MKCEDCEIDYPGDLVQPMSSGGGYRSLCGICALERSNRIHGANRKHFDGSMAESLRQEAIAFRKKLEQEKKGKVC